MRCSIAAMVAIGVPLWCLAFRKLLAPPPTAASSTSTTLATPLSLGAASRLPTASADEAVSLAVAACMGPTCDMESSGASEAGGVGHGRERGARRRERRRQQLLRREWRQQQRRQQPQQPAARGSVDGGKSASVIARAGGLPVSAVTADGYGSLRPLEPLPSAYALHLQYMRGHSSNRPAEQFGSGAGRGTWRAHFGGTSRDAELLAIQRQSGWDLSDSPAVTIPGQPHPHLHPHLHPHPHPHPHPLAISIARHAPHVERSR